MPNTVRNMGLYIPGTGIPDTAQVPLTTAYPGLGGNGVYAAGELRASVDVNDRTYTSVILDSGATAATPVGAVAANQLAFWKDKANGIVTNDPRFSQGGAVLNSYTNFVAGIFRAAVAAPGAYGTYMFILTRGNNIPVAAASGAAVGQIAVATTGEVATPGNTITGVAVGTAPGSESVGVIRTAVSSGVSNVDVDLPVLA